MSHIMFLQSALFKVADLNACNLKLRVGSERWTILVLVTCQCCPGVMKYCRTSCALRCWEGWSYPTSRCQYVDVSVDRRIPRPSLSALDECCHLSLQRTLYFKGYPIKINEKYCSKLQCFHNIMSPARFDPVSFDGCNQMRDCMSP